MSDLPTPITREERYLNGIAQGDTSNLPTPVGREEKYLDYIARNGGGGGGGTTNYNALDNKPQIAGTTLQGNKSLADLGIASASDVATSLAGKVDKVAGKGLSTNDYSDTEKGKVADNTGAIEAIVNVNGCCNVLDLSNPSVVSDGVTFTVNSDGSVTANGTAVTNSFIAFKNTATAHDMVVVGASGGVHIIAMPYGHRWEEVDEGIIHGINQNGFALQVDAGVTVNNVTVFPMLYDARLTPTGYVPYAMTNKELTDGIQNIPKIKIGQAYYEEVAVTTSYQGFYFGYTDYFTNHGYSGTLIGYRVQVDQATAPYSILVVENRLELLSAASQTVKLTWAPVYI